MILFERSAENPERFFACSAYRDRKLCSAYVTESDWNKSAVNKQAGNEHSYNKKLKKFDFVRENVLKQLETSRNPGFCRTCEVLVLDSVSHEKHNVIPIDGTFIPSKVIFLAQHFFPNHSLQIYMFRFQLLSPLENPKKEAQFLFSDSTITAILSFVEELNKTHVLCIAAPTIFQNSSKNGIKERLMLDIDARYVTGHVLV